MSAPATSDPIGTTVRLPDRRLLGFAEYGEPRGKALLYFHGHPGARVEAALLAAAALRVGIRLIGVDRPGMGLSTYQPGRRILDWPADVVHLADALGLDRFAVVGFSGGAPYALACARQIARRLTGCGLVSGVGDSGPLLSFLAAWVPWLLLPLVRRRLFRGDTRAAAALEAAAGRWPEADRRSLMVPGVKQSMAASLVEGLRPGARGAAYDGTLLGRGWGFRREDVAFPAVFIWHGELDQQVPVARARAVAEGLPHAIITTYPRDGHISTIVNHADEIVAALR